MKTINKPKFYFGNYLERINQQTKIYDYFSLFIELPNGEIYDVAKDKIIIETHIENIYNLEGDYSTVTNLIPAAQFFISEEVVKSNYKGCLKVLNYNFNSSENWIFLEDLIYENNKFNIKDECKSKYKLSLSEAKADYYKDKSAPAEMVDKKIQINDDIYIAKSVKKKTEVFPSIDAYYDNEYFLIKRTNYFLSPGYVFLKKENNKYFDITTGDIFEELSFEEIRSLEDNKNNELCNINNERYSEELIGFFGVMRLGDFIEKYNIPINSTDNIFNDINQIAGSEMNIKFSKYLTKEEIMAPNKEYISKSISLILTK